jgi:phosphoribosylformylglycinamidine synthase
MTPMSATGQPRLALVQFPGSNCDMDCVDALQRHFGLKLQPVWHTETTLPPVDAVILPGGFSYGDYLRSGALASHSPVMADVKRFVERGGPVIGICNGFQVLTESHLLPGALLRNQSRRFLCQYVTLTAEPGTSAYQKAMAGRTLRIPIAHGEGRYYIDADGLKRLQDGGQIAFRYAAADGTVSETDADSNPNGSLGAIAGVVSANGKVMGLMPHPERATDALLGGSADGLAIWQAFLAAFL